MTLGYPDFVPVAEVSLPQGRLPREVHFHLRAYEARQLPQVAPAFPLRSSFFFVRFFFSCLARFGEFYPGFAIRFPGKLLRTTKTQKSVLGAPCIC